MAENNSTGTAVATRGPNAIEQLMTSPQARKLIEPFLPEGTDILRVVATVQRAITADETKTLRKCTPQSLVLAVGQIHQWGLELAPGVAYLLPFKNNKKVDDDGKPIYEATPCADYKAIAAMMIGSGAVRHVEAREVREGDKFEYHFGLDGTLFHQPYGGREREKKPITHVYCILHLPFSARAFDVMTAEEVDAIRKQYSKQHKEGPLKPFYAKKTIIRRMAKTMPKDRRLAKFFDVIEKDERIELAEEEPQQPVSQVGAGDATASTESEAETLLDDRWIEQQDEQ